MPTSYSSLLNNKAKFRNVILNKRYISESIAMYYKTENKSYLSFISYSPEGNYKTNKGDCFQANHQSVITESKSDQIVGLTHPVFTT